MAIKKCPTCRPHPFQDSKYGPNMRVHNLAKQGSPKDAYLRCTVCGQPRRPSKS